MEDDEIDNLLNDDEDIAPVEELTDMDIKFAENLGGDIELIKAEPEVLGKLPELRGEMIPQEFVSLKDMIISRYKTLPEINYDKFNSELEAIGDNNELRLLLEDEFQANVKAIEDKYKEEREVSAKEAEDAAREEKRKKMQEDIQSASDLIGSLSDLNKASLEAELAAAGDNEAKKDEIRKKSFARDKALQLAMATVNGVQAVLSTFAGTPWGLIIKSIAASIAGATALANITKIARTQFQGSSGGGSAPSNLGNTARGANGANVDQVTITTTTIGEPTKVYVTEQDISSTQNKVSVNEAQATI